MPIQVIQDAIRVLAPHYGLKPEAFMPWADAYAESFGRSFEKSYYVLSRELVPEPCQRRLAAGGLVGKLLLNARNPDLGEDMLSTFYKQVGAVYSAHVVHRTFCLEDHEKHTFQGLAARVADFCHVKKRTETTRVKKAWPNYDGVVMPVTDQALRSMAYSLGTEMGIALHTHDRGCGRCDGLTRFASTRPAEATLYLVAAASQIEAPAEEPRAAWHEPITRPISRFFKPRS